MTQPSISEQFNKAYTDHGVGVCKAIIEAFPDDNGKFVRQLGAFLSDRLSTLSEGLAMAVLEFVHSSSGDRNFDKELEDEYKDIEKSEERLKAVNNERNEGVKRGVPAESFEEEIKDAENELSILKTLQKMRMNSKSAREQRAEQKPFDF